MIILSSHASDRIKERSINISEIETTIIDPDKSIKEDNLYKNYKVIYKYVIIVIYKIINDKNQFIITAIKSSKINKYIK
jgi:hypothetical protein